MKHVLLICLTFIIPCVKVTSSAWLPLSLYDQNPTNQRSPLNSVENWLAKRAQAAEGSIDDSLAEESFDDKRGRGNDYGWGMMFGKRAQKPTSKDYGLGMFFGKRNDPTERSNLLERIARHRNPAFLPRRMDTTFDNYKHGGRDWKRAEHYGWGMMFGKRSGQNGESWESAPKSDKRGDPHYGWGMMFGKRNADNDPFVAEMPDKDFDDYEADILQIIDAQQLDEDENIEKAGITQDDTKSALFDKRSPGTGRYRTRTVRGNTKSGKRTNNDYGWGMMFG